MQLSFLLLSPAVFPVVEGLESSLTSDGVMLDWVTSSASILMTSSHQTCSSSTPVTPWEYATLRLPTLMGRPTSSSVRWPRAVATRIRQSSRNRSPWMTLVALCTVSSHTTRSMSSVDTCEWKAEADWGAIYIHVYTVYRLCIYRLGGYLDSHTPSILYQFLE